MPLASCVRCNKMFNKVSTAVCQSCQPAEDADQDKIHAVLAENENLTPEEVANQANVELAVVHRMVREGLVTQVRAGEAAVCGKCGAPAISMSKKLCQACLDKLNAEVSKAQAKIRLEKKKPPQLGEYINARKAFEEKRK